MTGTVAIGLFPLCKDVFFYCFDFIQTRCYDEDKKQKHFPKLFSNFQLYSTFFTLRLKLQQQNLQKQSVLDNSNDIYWYSTLHRSRATVLSWLQCDTLAPRTHWEDTATAVCVGREWEPDRFLPTCRSLKLLGKLTLDGATDSRLTATPPPERPPQPSGGSQAKQKHPHNCAQTSQSNF